MCVMRCAAMPRTIQALVWVVPLRLQLCAELVSALSQAADLGHIHVVGGGAHQLALGGGQGRLEAGSLWLCGQLSCEAAQGVHW